MNRSLNTTSQRNPLLTIITNSLLLASLTNFAILPAIAKEAIALQPTIIAQTTETTETTETTPIAAQLIGIWQYQDPDTEALLRLVFAENQQMYTILPTEEGSYVAVEMNYQINSDTQPMQIDLQINSESKALTVFELTPEGKLRLELDGIAAGNTRPETLSENATLFAKVSDDPTLPENVATVELESQEEQARRVPIQYISLLAKAQQAYFLEKGTFAANLEELGITANLETQSYRYEIIKPETELESVTITARSKDKELPSYTAALFVTEVDGNKTTVGGICATNEASISPPATPTVVSNDSPEIQCPVGSSLLE
ncbi:MAG: type IV pilin-like G/H family protein [Oscillatoria sp. PMC 1068.18]|nr:type IV pilin-like G/H family protein [Oscillatoria sp. PMC 1076.18]MEC4991680.1 type IV pilin-like G/H family protein [Oscillatoria sp. PMC 1068.18]